jgi:hypothetical protein
MKYIAIIDESKKVDLEEKGILKGCKPIFKEMLVGKDGQSLYLTQGHLDCLMEYSQRKIIEEEIKRQNRFFDDLQHFAKEEAKLKGENK